MKLFVQKNKPLLLIFIVSFLIYSPSLFGFYTNDDFYHLKISHATNIFEFLDFFNLLKSSGGQLLYRPLTTHVFYFLGWSLFNLNPFGLHLVSFALFFITIFFVEKLAFEIKSNKTISLLTAFLYATSASHFGHLYYLATEIVLAAVFFPGVFYFTKFIRTGNKSFLVWSILFYFLSILAKENALVMPGIFILHYFFLKAVKVRLATFAVIIFNLGVFSLIYLYLHFFKYGVVSGEGYTFDFSLTRTMNTIAWYLFWSFNTPEMFLDFVGPGLRVNPNLLLYWGYYTKAIVTVFGVLILIVGLQAFQHFKKKLDIRYLIIGLGWFFITLLPIVFLPDHKFTFYLTLPLFGIVFILAEIFTHAKLGLLITIMLLWIVGSCATLSLTYKTNWITQGQKIAQRVDRYLSLHSSEMTNKKIAFVDTPEDENLPWSPTQVVKVTLSDKNYFEVFHPGLTANVYYVGAGNLHEEQGLYKISSRMFLGY